MAILRHPNAIATAMTINPCSSTTPRKFFVFDQPDAFGAEQMHDRTLFHSVPGGAPRRTGSMRRDS